MKQVMEQGYISSISPRITFSIFLSKMMLFFLTASLSHCSKPDAMVQLLVLSDSCFPEVTCWEHNFTDKIWHAQKWVRTFIFQNLPKKIKQRDLIRASLALCKLHHSFNFMGYERAVWEIIKTCRLEPENPYSVFFFFFFQKRNKNNPKSWSFPHRLCLYRGTLNKSDFIKL